MLIKKLSDEELIKLSKNGDAKATEELIRRNENLVRKLANQYFLSSGGVDDLVQEGRLAVVSAIKNYNGSVPFKNFLITCVKNALKSLILKDKRKKNLPLNNYVSLSGYLDCDTDKMEIVVDSRMGPEETYINNERKAEMQKLISTKLSDTEYKILYWRLQGVSYKEIGYKLGKNAKTVDNALQRIRRKFEQMTSASD